ncbi:NAD(P)/FAD-dependent oxidoreductase [Rhizobium sp. NTR19]|uniref:NAD(P)/FAD-dependent oxidoreductase n=1 Tax=Neorhizobium turbinariae TaxID=2937795 RepID=A0ABT0ISP9_9HYPH|nr:NAD(P)/FAD-dependent oxidoreductase [Neorhizobium turbinariae]MCK8780834.1 NAD(P)/FAD-dependent oxidoreductase [Neorhizobium turbinariae]
MTDEMPENSIRTDVLVIGAGQAGLAAAHFLTLEDIPHIVLDALPVVGDSWRRRYDALRLFTPRSLSSLPGMPLQGDPDGYAGRDEFADYLARYGRGRRVETGTEVTVLRRRGDLFEAAADDGRTFTSRAVVVATGAFTRPAVPALSAGFAPEVQQMHVSQFRNAGSVVDGTVLIVGDGASGRDAAMALAATHDVVLARGRPRRLFPERILGRSTWWWLHRLGLLRARPDSLIGRRMRRIDPFPLRGNGDADLARLGISLKPRLMAADGPAAVHGDGSRSFPAAIVWATGYAEDFRWIEIPGAASPDGRAIHAEGVSPVDGLYHLGRPWQRNRASGLILGVRDDARSIVGMLVHRLRTGSGCNT